MNKNPIKKWKHNCEECMFQGRHNSMDWYVCYRTSDDGSVLARYGDSGSHYWSMPINLIDHMDLVSKDGMGTRIADITVASAKAVLEAFHYNNNLEMRNNRPSRKAITKSDIMRQVAEKKGITVKEFKITDSIITGDLVLGNKRNLDTLNKPMPPPKGDDCLGFPADWLV